MKLVRNINGNTKIVGTLGNSIDNSMLPILHNTIINTLGFDLIYVPFYIKEDKLAEAILGLRALNVLGFDIVMPYKKEIMKYIDDNMRLSFLMGSIDTVKNIDERLYGYNTIGEGFVRVARDYGLSLKNKIVTILGAGEKSRSIAVKLANTKVSKINIIDKSIQYVNSIKNAINDNIEEVVDVYTYKDKRFFDICRESDILINAAFVETLSKVERDVFFGEKVFKKNQFIYDIINTQENTFFLDAAKRRGCKTINGLDMSIYCCMLSYEIWTGYKFNNNEIEKIYSVFK